MRKAEDVDTLILQVKEIEHSTFKEISQITTVFLIPQILKKVLRKSLSQHTHYLVFLTPLLLE